jgi:ribosomal protein L37E
MLQWMQLSSSSQAFNTRESWRLTRLLPVSTHVNGYPVTCNNCGYVNNASNNYCTNCGFPAKPNSDRMALYNFRLFKRKEFLKECEGAIARARTTLYFMSVICITGIGYLFSNNRTNHLRGGVLMILSLIYFLLGRWSIKNPFTALLISFLMLISFMAINMWAEFIKMFTTATGVYLLFVQFILFYFLFRGVKAAYQVDIIEEEFKI